MLSAFFRSKQKGRHRTSAEFPFALPKKDQEHTEARHAAADWTGTESDDEETEDDDRHNERRRNNKPAACEDEGRPYDDHEDGEETSPLLPIFSAAHLGMWQN